MAREKIKKLEKILEKVVEFSDGSMTLRKYISHNNGSVDGWYAIN